MENLETLVKKLIELMGFSDFRVDVKPDQRRGSVFIYDSPSLIKENLPTLVESMNHILQMIVKKNFQPPIFFDINGYRQERENLIAELARAAAKKVLQTKTQVPLPAMNSYERRLVHVELAIHPEVTTESVGVGKERYVVVKPINEENSKS
jgi:predicted RNA-binding protein Jag